jgi:P2-related tail formation protein
VYAAAMMAIYVPVTLLHLWLCSRQDIGIFGLVAVKVDINIGKRNCKWILAWWQKRKRKVLTIFERPVVQ